MKSEREREENIKRKLWNCVRKEEKREREKEEKIKTKLNWK
jgi:hypothetical protein